ncbi:Sec-independent protein translocase, TatC subunit [Actinosynnema mirum DSM 43827]|uniref:Sec-independent protein translocase protein TatC n=2 Tax=Actinosynnema TaxID=40566 RepID=C6WIE9_ACTMD|nr:Sec-independent protein translocase, TatC subunit [Actinosynnema mirum DSM 43827]
MSRRRESRKLRSKRHNPEGTMSLRDHLYELRNRLGWALLFLTIGSVFGFIWWSWRILGAPSLGDIIISPYCGIPLEDRFNQNQECQLLQTQPFEAFMIQLKVGAAAGAVLTSPLWLNQLWRFIAPGLYAKERKFALIFVGVASLLFLAGAVLAFYVVPQGLSVLVGFGDNKFLTALSGTAYIDFVLALLIIFGVSFELPLVVVMLNAVGILPYEKLKRWRRGLVFGLFVFAAFATPGTDPISMVALAISLALLFEMATQIARLHDKRKARKRVEEGFGPEENWDKLSDDEASPFDYTPTQVEDSGTAGRTATQAAPPQAQAAQAQAAQAQGQGQPVQPQSPAQPTPPAAQPERRVNYDDDAT